MSDQMKCDCCGDEARRLKGMQDLHEQTFAFVCRSCEGTVSAGLRRLGRMYGYGRPFALRDAPRINNLRHLNMVLENLGTLEEEFDVRAQLKKLEESVDPVAVQENLDRVYGAISHQRSLMDAVRPSKYGDAVSRGVCSAVEVAYTRQLCREAEQATAAQRQQLTAAVFRGARRSGKLMPSAKAASPARQPVATGKQMEVAPAAQDRPPVVPRKNKPCPCGSGRNYKNCHGAK